MASNLAPYLIPGIANARAVGLPDVCALRGKKYHRAHELLFELLENQFRHWPSQPRASVYPC